MILAQVNGQPKGWLGYCRLTVRYQVTGRQHFRGHIWLVHSPEEPRAVGSHTRHWTGIVGGLLGTVLVPQAKDMNKMRLISQLAKSRSYWVSSTLLV
jgi:hypothetical protein